MARKEVLSDSTADQMQQGAPGFDCTWRDGGIDAAWVRLTGKLDSAAAPLLERTLRLAAVRPRVVLDLRALASMDSSGVRVIVQAGVRAARAGRRLVVVRGRAQVDRMLALSGASDGLEVVDLKPLQPPVQALVQLAHRSRGVTPAAA